MYYKVKNKKAKSKMRKSGTIRILYTFCFLLFNFYLVSCKQIDLYEQDATIPKYEWSYDYNPSFTFTIADTSSFYNLFVVIRHTDAYRYNNICLNLGMHLPGDTASYQRFDLSLGQDATGWEGTGID